MKKKLIKECNWNKNLSKEHEKKSKEELKTWKRTNEKKQWCVCRIHCQFRSLSNRIFQFFFFLLSYFCSDEKPLFLFSSHFAVGRRFFIFVLPSNEKRNAQLFLCIRLIFRQFKSLFLCFSLFLYFMRRKTLKRWLYHLPFGIQTQPIFRLWVFCLFCRLTNENWTAIVQSFLIYYVSASHDGKCVLVNACERRTRSGWYKIERRRNHSNRQLNLIHSFSKHRTRFTCIWPI